MMLCANPGAQFRSHRAEIEEAMRRVLDGNRYILGPEVEALEQEFARYIGVRHAVGVANGTDALELAVRALGLVPGDEVVTVSHTAVATVAALDAAGVKPVLVDVEPGYYTLDAAQLAEVLSPRTRAVIAVHLYGQAADLDAIGEFCRKHRLALIEDVAQAHGAKWQGRHLGSVGDIGCFSCYPTKNLGAIGDGGLVTTDNGQFAGRIRMLREYGWKQRYVSDIPGRNSRLDELQAAILRVKLRYLDEDNEKRRRLAGVYDDLLRALPVQLPKVRSGAEHVYHLYVITAANRLALIESLRREDVSPAIHYPVPIHRQTAYIGRIGRASSLRVTERLAEEVLSLPLYPELTHDDLARVGRGIASAVV